MNTKIQLFLELRLDSSKDKEFKDAIVELTEIVKTSGIGLVFNFYRDPVDVSKIYAIETHDTVESIASYLQIASSLLSKIQSLARPVRVLILGDLPPEMRKAMEQRGATVVPAWLNN